MWTDEELTAKQVEREEDAAKARALGNNAYADNDLRVAELYRLSRLGLAAEQVGRETIEAVAFDNEGYTADDFAQLQVFLNHPAWRK